MQDSPESTSGSSVGGDEITSPVIATAMVSAMKTGTASGIPVDSPLFAQLSPQRLMRAKQVRALEEELYSAGAAKAEEVDSGKLFPFAGLNIDVPGAWLLRRVLVVAALCLLVFGLNAGTSGRAAPVATVSVSVSSSASPATVAQFVVSSKPSSGSDAGAKLASSSSFRQSAMSAKLPLRTSAGTAFSVTVLGAHDSPAGKGKWGGASSAPLVLRSAAQRLSAVLREFVEFVAGAVRPTLAQVAGKAAAFFGNRARDLADRVNETVQKAVEALPLPLMDSL